MISYRIKLNIDIKLIVLKMIFGQMEIVKL